MEYTKLEQFFVNIFKKQDKLSYLEKYCLNTYNTFMSACISKLCENNLNYAVNAFDILKVTHAFLLKKGFYIVCLKFSDGNEIYIQKDDLEEIPFFKCAFDTIENFDDVIIDFPLIGVADNYKYMEMIIKFLKIPVFNVDLTYSDILQLAEIDGYLLGVTYFNKQCKFADWLWDALMCDFRKAQNEELPEEYLSEEYLDIVCDICIALKRNVNDFLKCIKFHNIMKFKDELLNSKILKQLEVDDINSHKAFVTYMNGGVVALLDKSYIK